MDNHLLGNLKTGICWAMALGLLAGCGSDSKDEADAGCQTDETMCEDNVVMQCDDGEWKTYDDCEAQDLACVHLDGEAVCAESEEESDKQDSEDEIESDTALDKESDPEPEGTEPESSDPEPEGTEPESSDPGPEGSDPEPEGSDPGPEGTDPRSTEPESSDSEPVGSDSEPIESDPEPTGEPGIVVDPTDPLTIDEASGTATFRVRLDSQPTASVAIELTNSDTSVAAMDQTVLIFTSENWSDWQIVTLTGIDNGESDGNKPFVIVTAPAISDDANYDEMNAPNIEGTVVDDDSAGIVVTSGEDLSTSEAGGAVTVRMVLTSIPTDTVTVPLSVSDETEAKLSKTSIVFTPANWNLEQIVNITGLDDYESDGSISYTLVMEPCMSTDPNYDGMDLDDIAILNTDNDEPGVVISQSEIVTSETADTASFTVVLTSMPADSVMISVTSSNTKEGVVSPSTLSFDAEDWNTPKLVTVTGVDDVVVDGDVEYTIQLGDAVSNDDGYGGLELEDVNVVNLDNDTAGVNISPTSGLQTSELGDKATFSVALGTQPSADVTIALESTNTAEGTISTDALVFTSSNWNVAKEVTVTGIDDDDLDGPVGYMIATTVTSADPNYSEILVTDVAVVNLDDEVTDPAILVSPEGGLQTTEAGGTATFSVFLGSPPLDAVGISLSLGDSTEGEIDETTLVFTASTWNTPQTVTVTGLDDGIDDGDITYAISASVVSKDDDYEDLVIPDISVTNLDDDEVGITVDVADILETSEYRSEISFTVVLDCEPAGTVTIPISSSDEGEGSVSPDELSFTTSNWDVPKSVTVTGVNDTDEDGDIPYTIRIEPAESTDEAYDGYDASDVIVINKDNDPVVACGNPAMIDDFEDNDLNICENGGRTGTWYVYNETPTATQTLDVVLLDEPREDSILVGETIASKVSDWGATMGLNLFGVDQATRLPYDVSNYTGIRFWAKRGDESTYSRTVLVNIVQQNTANTEQGGTCDQDDYDCSDHYADSISVTSTWKQFKLPFTGFYQQGFGKTFSRDLENVLGFEFLLDYSSFDLMIDDLEFY